MISYPPAKINIGLNIIERRMDGYHHIESVFYPIPLVDILEINKSTVFEFSSSGLPINGDVADNLVVKAYRLLKDQYKIPPVKIHLHKQIPMGAGLGGGSADGAYTLLMLNSIFNLTIPLVQLEQISTQLGSDCPFFMENKPKFVEGIGEKLTDISVDLTGKYLWLINPEIHVSTAEAYQFIEPHKPKSNLVSSVQHPVSSWRDKVKNDFEKPIFKLYPKIKQIKDFMYEQGALFASMTGTGSTVYAICEETPAILMERDYEKVLEL